MQSDASLARKISVELSRHRGVAAGALLLLGGGFVFSLLAVRSVAAGLMVVAGALFCWLAFARPLYAFLLTIAVIPFDRLTAFFAWMGAPRGSVLQSLTAPKLMLAVVVAVVVVKGLAARTPLPVGRLLRPPVPLLMLLFFLVCCLSLTQSTSPGKSLFALSSLFNCILLSCLLILLIADTRTLHGLIAILAYGYILYGLIGVYEAVTKTHVLEMAGIELPEGPMQTEETFRIVGAAGSPDFFAQSLLIGLFVVLAQAKRARPPAKVLCVAGLFVLVFDLLGTGSRGVALAGLVAAATFLVLSRIKHKRLIVAAALGGAVVLLTLSTFIVPEATLGRYLGQRGGDSVSYRFGLWNKAVQMVMDKPLLGIGLNTFADDPQRYFDPRVPLEPLMVHNTHLQVAAEAGIPAFFVWAVLWVTVGTTSYLATTRLRDERLRHIAVCFFCALVGSAMFAATSNVLLNQLIWMLFAFCAISYRLADDETRSEAGPAEGSSTPAPSGHP